MKTVILIRHSEPIKERTMPTELLPLSAAGHIKARKLFALDIFHTVEAVYTSPYKRAYSTAEELSDNVIVDDRLRERELGDPLTLTEDFWGRQYEDHDFKNEGGESLNDAGGRMHAAMNDIISAMREESTVAVVSHAAAICAYLLRSCSVEVIDAESKTRRIVYSGITVLSGKLETPSAFILEYERGELVNLRFTSADENPPTE